jgi:hypothetical protein
VHRLFRRLAQRLQGGAPARVDLDGEADVAVLDDQPRDHAQGDNVLISARVFDALQGVQYNGFVDPIHFLENSPIRPICTQEVAGRLG